MKIVQAIKKLNAIFKRALLNFRGRPFLCTADRNLCKRATSVAHLTNFSFEFVCEIFTEDASLLLLYHGAKKVKNDQKLKSRGSCLKIILSGNPRRAPRSGLSSCWAILNIINQLINPCPLRSTSASFSHNTSRRFVKIVVSALWPSNSDDTPYFDTLAVDVLRKRSSNGYQVRAHSEINFIPFPLMTRSSIVF